MFMTTNFFIMLAIVVYLAIMLVIGFVYSKRNNSTEDFYLGGRKMGPLVTAMSAEASDMSSWLLMGLPGVAYLSGICDAAWTAIGLAVGTWLNWFSCPENSDVIQIISARSLCLISLQNDSMIRIMLSQHFPLLLSLSSSSLTQHPVLLPVVSCSTAYSVSIIRLP